MLQLLDLHEPEARPLHPYLSNAKQTGKTIEAADLFAAS